MLDDDIQYMGTRPATRAVSDSPFLAHQSVTGIIMHIERSSSNAPYDLIFRRANSNVIQIGRRPGTEAEQKQGDNVGAMFRCAVVSRKHAKIAFSDSGHAYLIDMNSHHGTHVRKPGETVSRKLIAETPTSLSDGDIITFGKSVGRNSEIVRPVVARIELLRGSQHENTFKPLAMPVTPITPSNHPNVSPSSSSSSRSSSGRYGVFINSSSSSDGNSSPISAHNSDPEEVPASGANALPLLPRGSLSRDSGSHLGRAFEALKRLLPPAHSALTGVADSEEDMFPTLPPIAPLHTPDFSIGSPGYLPSPIYSPSSPSRGSYSPRSLSPMFNIRNALFDDDPYHYPMGFDVAHHDVFEEDFPNQSRRGTSSPMDLASPSPPISANYSPRPEEASGEPSIIGAWPKSRSVSPIHFAEVDIPPLESAPFKTATHEERAKSPANISEPPTEVPNEISNESGKYPLSQVDEIPPPITESSDSQDKIDSAVSELQHGLAKLQTEVTKLQAHKRKYKNRFNSNVHTISDKLLDLDERVADVNAQYTMLLDQVEHTTHVDVPDLQAQVEVLQRQADAFPVSHEMSTASLLHERNDVKESIRTLKELVDEMRKLRESTQANMAAELEAVRAARDAALATIAAHVEAPQLRSIETNTTGPYHETPQTPIPSSLKRKRSDENGDESQIRVDIGVDAGVTMVGATDPTFTDTTLGLSEIDVPSPKRARRVATVVLQTATAVTVGAVATWSALAFS
ncbi:hypothetical protein BDZ94DRAFT_1319246 [Collybia nuda]|uniref:FHA domain-containing protein n=1 Tax=Collybia nuda TaxID=64659 RepID=A0A9P5YCH9_9AGAR|nr:hypothetical protein BDZ94DRAFT_1319246 [Collybia nuda]